MRHVWLIVFLAACSSEAGPLPASDPSPDALDALGSGMTAGLVDAGGIDPRAGSAAPGFREDAGAPDADLPETDAAEPAPGGDSGSPEPDTGSAGSAGSAGSDASPIPSEAFVGTWTVSTSAEPLSCDKPPTWDEPVKAGTQTLTVNPGYSLTFGQGPAADLPVHQGVIEQGVLTWSSPGWVDTQVTFRLWLLTPDSLRGIEHDPASEMFFTYEYCNALTGARQ